MSLTGVSPLIKDWIKLGLNWAYGWQPKIQAFTVPAGSAIKLPSQEYIFEAPEGILLTLSAVFDHTKCGIRLEANPNLDTESFFTVENLMLFGNSNIPVFLTVGVPPKTPPGIYSIANLKEWPWIGWMRLYVINSDTVDHRCLSYSYTVATLKEPRPRDTIIPLQTIELTKLYLELFPETSKQIKAKFEEVAKDYVKKLRPESLSKEEK